MSVLALGCAKPGGQPVPAAQHEPAPMSSVAPLASPLPLPTTEPEASVAPPPVQAVFDPEALRQLERRGLDFASYGLGMTRSSDAVRATPQLTTKALMADGGFASIARVLEQDLQNAKQRDRAAGVGMRYGHRLFDSSWLASDKFYFQLVAVVNRIDRKVFAPEHCGEVRLIYRLAYASVVSGQDVSSRLPMTVNVVRYVTDDDCSRALARWQLPSDAGTEAADALLGPSGPLGAKALAHTQPKSVEVNLQSVRWPSTVRPNMAGHAEYVLRVFTRHSAGGPFSPGALENTPDAEALAASPKLRAELRSWLSKPEVLASVDRGTVTLPERFLAKVATSVAPRGLGRLKNRVFAQLFSAKDFEGVPLDGLRRMKSPAQLLRRLDGLSCPGCHQSKSVAGFHILGRDRADMKADALSIPHSPHVTDEMRRRRAYAEELIAGRTPDEYRAPAERSDHDGGWGTHCGLVQAFSSWTCGEGLTCQQVDDPEVGQCMPKEAQVSDACELGTIDGKTDAHKDFTRLSAAKSCGDGRVCEANGVGFPGGMCAGACRGLPDEALCGGIAVLTSFNACLARSEPFEKCILNNTRPGALRRCSHESPCREDYVCARMPSGQGACLPPYFLFQLRVDGHVY